MAIDRDKFVDLARELGREWQEAELPAGSYARFKERVSKNKQRRVWAWALAGTVALLLLGGVWFSAPETAGGLHVIERTPELVLHTTDEGIEVKAGEAVFVEPRTQASFSGHRGLKLRHEKQGVRVLRGITRVVVPKQHDAPVRVFVSHGQIEVLGTSFTVEQGSTGGRVQLHEGRIEFSDEEGRLRRLQPGASLRWPLKTRESPQVRPQEELDQQDDLEAKPKTAQKNPPPRDSERRQEFRRADFNALQRTLDRLRAQEDYPGVTRALTRALTQARGTIFSEELSYELGDVLTYHGVDPERACQHWRRHLKQFRAGRYQRLIKQAQASLACRNR